MNYQRQIEEIEKYFKNGEKAKSDLRIGAEFEHFLIDLEDYKTVSYYGEKGVGKILEEVSKNGWTPIYEGDYILGLEKGHASITLEPGSQLEFSSKAEIDIVEIEKSYIEFLKEINKVLDKYNYSLIAVGYHPETKIEEIKLLPKKRYDLMFDYFKSKGSHAHNMMKGTAAFQVSMDYTSEEDYKKKFRVANSMTTLLYSLFDNSFYFEGGIWDKHNLRTYIWNNCDPMRAGIVPHALDGDFGYRQYGEYILNTEPIFTLKDRQVVATGNAKVRDIFDPDDYTIAELEHLLTMVFPDVRTKKYIEIRVMDSVPYPYNMSIIAFLKGILYNENSLNEVFELVANFTDEDLRESKESIIENGVNGMIKGKKILDFGRELVEISKEGLGEGEVGYLYPMETLLNIESSLYDVTKANAKRGKDAALESSLLKDIKEE